MRTANCNAWQLRALEPGVVIVGAAADPLPAPRNGTDSFT